MSTNAIIDFFGPERPYLVFDRRGANIDRRVTMAHSELEAVERTLDLGMDLARIMGVTNPAEGQASVIELSDHLEGRVRRGDLTAVMQAMDPADGELSNAGAKDACFHHFIFVNRV